MRTWIVVPTVTLVTWRKLVSPVLKVSGEELNRTCGIKSGFLPYIVQTKVSNVSGKRASVSRFLYGFNIKKMQIRF